MKSYQHSLQLNVQRSSEGDLHEGEKKRTTCKYQKLALKLASEMIQGIVLVQLKA